MNSKLKQNIPVFLLFLFFSYLYIHTAAPGIYDGDSGELAAAVNTLGLAHPTGFPLYMLTGKLFALLVPIKDIAYRLNIFSGLLTATSLVFVYYALKNFGNSSFSSIAASVVLGFGRNTIWANAGRVGVYPLSLLFVSILFFIFSRWRIELKTKYLYFYGFLWGLSMGTHSLMLIMGVPFLFMMREASALLKNKISVFAKIALLTIAPLFQYIYLLFAYKRNGIITWGSMSSFGDFVYYITQRQYTSKFLASSFPQFFKKAVALLTGEFTILFFIIAVIGLFVLFKKKKTLFLPLALVGFANIGMMYAYSNAGGLLILSRYIFIIDVVLAMAIAFGLEAVARWLKAKSGKRFSVLCVAIILLILFQFTQAFAYNNRRNNGIVEDTAHNILSTLEPNSIVISYGDVFTNMLWYSQSIGKKDDVIVIDASSIVFDWYVENLVKRYPDVVSNDLKKTKSDGARLVMLVKDNFGKRPIFSMLFNSSSSTTITQELDFIPVGLLFRVSLKGAEIRESITDSAKIWDAYELGSVRANFYHDFMLSDLVRYYALAALFTASYYYESGFIKEALVFLEKSLEFYPDNPVAIKNLEYIKNQIQKTGQ